MLFHYAECHIAECCFIMLSVIMLSVIMLGVIALSAVALYLSIISNESLTDWITFPDTKLKYFCPDKNWCQCYQTFLPLSYRQNKLVFASGKHFGTLLYFKKCNELKFVE